MRVIGITGGVGSGKSSVLKLLKERFNAYILIADDIAKETMCRGNAGYEQVVEMFSEDILDKNKNIDRTKLATIVFHNENKRIVLNSIIHPLVKKIILNKINELKIAGTYDYVFVEAALLIEDHYDVICDELWYIYVPADMRRQRLKDSRGYSDEKIDSVFKSQLNEEAYKKACINVIDNSKDIEDTMSQIEKLL
jgi:dephospho-CoA kinase